MKNSSTASSLLGKISGAFSNKGEAFWALQDVSFSVEQGKALGVVGPNGAGKSTLLKLLARITHPSAGRFETRGRVSSLLEVGTGFHPELSGYDNIFLNGSILGMSKHEIRSSLEEIIDFSGVENFINMPVKHYSSGMKVRLAFSVAAHLTAEILLIDEVLAVGDASFQRKCLERMEDVSRHQGRTILFVSHNMRAVRDLCNEALYIDGGKLVKTGTSEEITHFYNQSLESKAIEIQLHDRKDREGTGTIKLQTLRFVNVHGEPVQQIQTGQEVYLEADYQGEKPPTGLNLRLSIGKENDGFISALSNHLAGVDFENLPASGTLRCKLSKFPFMAGKYVINARVTNQNIVTDDVKRAMVFEVVEGDYFGSGDLYSTTRTGLYIEQEWSVR